MAQLETGRRDAGSLAELWGLSWALDVDLAHWLSAAPGTLVALTEELFVPAATLRASLSGADAVASRSIESGWSTPGTRRAGQEIGELAQELDAHDAEVAAAASGEAESKAARALGVSPRWLTELAFWRWGRSFTEEREQRLAAVAPPDADARTMAALRGHISRSLRAELAPHVAAKPEPERKEQE